MNVVADRTVGRRKSENTEQLVVRVPAPLRARLEALTPKLGQPGVYVTLTDVIRVALMRGVDVIEAELSSSKPSPRKR